MNISHDSVNRFLERENYLPKDLFNQSKLQLDLEGGVVSDDSVLDNPIPTKWHWLGTLVRKTPP